MTPWYRAWWRPSGHSKTGHAETGTEILDQTIAQAHDLVSGLIRRADMGTRTEPLHTQLQSARDCN